MSSVSESSTEGCLIMSERVFLALQGKDRPSLPGVFWFIQSPILLHQAARPWGDICRASRRLERTLPRWAAPARRGSAGTAGSGSKHSKEMLWLASVTAGATGGEGAALGPKTLWNELRYKATTTAGERILPTTSGWDRKDFSVIVVMWQYF